MRCRSRGRTASYDVPDGLMMVSAPQPMRPTGSGVRHFSTRLRIKWSGSSEASQPVRRQVERLAFVN
jgi:hypothetical protein